MDVGNIDVFVPWNMPVEEASRIDVHSTGNALLWWVVWGCHCHDPVISVYGSAGIVRRPHQWCDHVIACCNADIILLP